MPPAIDLTPFGFTPTESRMYAALVRHGPGTGYALARATGLARANAYSALEGLVAKGAARVDGDHPKRYRPEAPSTLLARLSNAQGEALDRLGAALANVAGDDGPAVVEVISPRGLLQLLTREIARANERVWLCAPPEAFPILAPALRRARAHVPAVDLRSTGAVTLEFAEVGILSDPGDWPGEPIVCVVDRHSALLALRTGEAVQGYWSSTPAFVAGAAAAFEQLRRSV
ncbi:MAG TPA: helix-turn-helix domain-containing protein [Gemmatimonadales bacterium]|nr:helix-turn-helix domain-containing protein [Gemmatimonadales bacterium]